MIARTSSKDFHVNLNAMFPLTSPLNVWFISWIAIGTRHQLSNCKFRCGWIQPKELREKQHCNFIVTLCIYIYVIYVIYIYITYITYIYIQSVTMKLQCCFSRNSFGCIHPQRNLQLLNWCLVPMAIQDMNQTLRGDVSGNIALRFTWKSLLLVLAIMSH